MELIQTVNVTSNVSEINFTNIPQTYQHLYVVGALSYDARGELDWNFNDNFNNYNWANQDNTTVTESIGAQIDTGNIGTDTRTSFMVDIMNYSINEWTVLKWFHVDGDLGNLGFNQGAGRWRVNTAVTKITISSTTGSFLSSSVASLYGI